MTIERKADICAAVLGVCLGAWFVYWILGEAVDLALHAAGL